MTRGCKALRTCRAHPQESTALVGLWLQGRFGAVRRQASLRGALAARWLVGAALAWLVPSALSACLCRGVVDAVVTVPAKNFGVLRAECCVYPVYQVDDSRGFSRGTGKDKVRTSLVSTSEGLLPGEAVESGPRQKQDVENQRLDRAPNPGRHEPQVKCSSKGGTLTVPKSKASCNSS
ncbi:hypothetical protein MTO96_020084 [Rhipicephalus appendiculatus]